MSKATKAGSAPAQLTAYVVLQAIDLRACIDGESDVQVNIGLSSARRDFTAWLPVLNQTTEDGPDGQPKVFNAPSKTHAIRQHTGEGADVIEGVWKALPLSSWRGGLRTRRITQAERLPLDD